MADRLEQYDKIRLMLDNPYAQQPSPEQVVNQMLITENALNLRLVNTGHPWNLISSQLVTVAGTSVYDVPKPADGIFNPGKAYFVIRTTGNDDIPSLPVPFDDISQLDYGKLPTGVNDHLAVPEKMSFYRTGSQDQVIKAVITPIPQEVLTYTIYFLAGNFERTDALMDNVPLVPELADYLNLKAALALLPVSMWRDDDAYNMQNRGALAAGLQMQLAGLEPIVEKYIRNINKPTTFEMDYWND